MPRLRMKDDPVDVEAVLKRERRDRRRQRREEARARTSDSMSPPRIRRASPSRPPPPDWNTGFDESSLPPDQARKLDEAEFAERLADAEAEDSGVGYFEDLLYEREMSNRAAAFAYGGAAGIALGKGVPGVAGGGVLAGLDEEEYAEYVRAGMWRRKHKDEAERVEALDRERKRKAEQEQAEREEKRKREQERVRRLEEKAQRRSKAEEGDARLRYDRAWALLLAQPPPPAAKTDQPVKATDEATLDPAAPSTGARALRFSDFAWPLYPSVPFPPLSWPGRADITPTALSAFLLAHLPADKRKAALRSAVLAYHPDRFERLVQRAPEDPPELRDRIRELGLAVSQTLNDLMKAGGEA